MDHPGPLAYCAGRFMPQEEACVSVADAGFVWGATVTDLCRTVRHALYRWPDHLDRFRRSCRAARIYPPLGEEDITRLAHDLTAHNARFLAEEEDLALVLIVTPGVVGHLVGGRSNGDPPHSSFLMHTFRLTPARYRHLFEQGAHLVVPSIRQVPAECVDPRIKQRSRLHWWLAQQEAQRIDPDASALLLDHNGHITETAAANFLVVRQGTVLSPPPGTILEGVSLRVVRELCDRLRIPFRERPLTLHDCLNADEALLTCTTFCLAGVSRFNGVPCRGPARSCSACCKPGARTLGSTSAGKWSDMKSVLNSRA